MKKRKRSSRRSLWSSAVRSARTTEQPQRSESDDLCDEEDDILPEPQAPKTQPLSKNPIIASMQRGLRRRDLHAFALAGNYELPPEKIRRVLKISFGDEAISEVGVIVIEALIRGDKTLPNTIKKARKEADHVFHRDREKGLLDKFSRWLWSLPEPLPPSAELRKQFEEEKNHGKELKDYQWRRLRKAHNLAKDETKPWDKVKSQTRNC